MNDDELFDGVAVSPFEGGESFGMTAACYQRMAACAMRASEYGHVDPVLIRKRAGGGCELLLFGTANQYTLRVSAASAPARIIVVDARIKGKGERKFFKTLKEAEGEQARLQLFKSSSSTNIIRNGKKARGYRGVTYVP